MGIDSKKFILTPEDVTYVFKAGYREATPEDVKARKVDWSGKVPTAIRTDVIGCTHSNCAFGRRLYTSGDSDRSMTPATTAWVAKPYYSGTEGVVFYCSRHTGLIRSLRSRTSGYGDDTIMQVAGARGKDEWVPEDALPLATLGEVASDPSLYVRLVNARRDARVAAAKKAARDYLTEHMSQYRRDFHSDIDPNSHLGMQVSIENADEYGRHYVAITGSYRQKGAPGDIRRLIKALESAVNIAEQRTPRE